MQRLKKLIKDKKIEGVFLLYGQEQFVLNAYLEKAIEAALINSDKTMNLDIFNSPTTDIQNIIDAMDTLPFLGDKRVIIIKEFDLFNSKNASKVEKLLSAIDNIPESTVLFITETDIDKRSKLYKQMNKQGICVEFKPLSESELIQYIADRLNKSNKRIERSVAQHFIHTIGFELVHINNELEKLISYCQDKEIITTEAIDEICTKSVENRIFELVDCMGTNKRELALKLYYDLLMLKEPPMRIHFMITRQFRLILQTKLLLEQKADNQTILSSLKIPPFVLNKNIKQAKSFTVERLKQALNDCLKVEVDMKTGKMDITLGIELLIIKSTEKFINDENGLLANKN